MIIPIRCFTCGKVLADKWLYFKRKLEERKSDMEEDTDSNVDFFFEDRPCSKLLEELGLPPSKVCCRRHLLAHVDLVDII